MVAISISSSILPGRPEAVVAGSDGLHMFDLGRTSILRIRIKAARVYTATIVVGGGGADSLGGARYIIGAEREDGLMKALGDEAYRYIKDRTGAAVARVGSEAIGKRELPDALIDASGKGSLGGIIGPQAQLRYDLGVRRSIASSRREQAENEDD